MNESNDQVDMESVNVINNELTESVESGSRTKWFHHDSCTACTVGLNARMKELVDTGMSKLKAAKVMSEETGGTISANTIRARYEYHVGPTKKRTKKVAESCNPVSRRSEQDGQAEISTHSPPPDL